MNISFLQVRHFAQYVIEQAGKGQTIAALVEDFNTTAEVLGFSDLMIVKPGRVAKLVELMNHVISRLDAMPEYAERVPDVTPEKRAEHLEHAEHLRGIFRSHGIDPKDFDACLDYIIGNGNIVPRYWAKIYVDYIHGDDLDATRPTASLPPLGRVTLPSQAPLWDCPKAGSDRTVIALCGGPVVKGTQVHQQIERLIVTGQQAGLLRADGYTGELEIVDVMPGFADDIIAADGWRPMTDQEARAAFNYQDQLKLNKFPRGKCARRMLTLGWHFNED